MRTFLLALLVSAQVVTAQQTGRRGRGGAPPAPTTAPTSAFVDEKPIVTHHEIQLNGKSIKSHSITGSKLKRNTLTGTQIRESKLATVPNADKLDKLDSTAFLRSGAGAGGALAGSYPNPSLAPPEPFHLVGAPGEPAFQNGWSNYPSVNGFAPAAFYKDPLRRVYLTGVITGGTALMDAFTLPSGYKPAENHAYAVTAGTGTPKTASVNVRSDGGVFIFNNIGGADPVSLDGVSFRVP